MKIAVQTTTEIVLKELRLCIPIDDEEGVRISLLDGKGNVRARATKALLPKFMDGAGNTEAYLEIDMKSGKILNWNAPGEDEISELYGTCEPVELPPRERRPRKAKGDQSEGEREAAAE